MIGFVPIRHTGNLHVTDQRPELLKPVHNIPLDDLHMIGVELQLNIGKADLDEKMQAAQQDPKTWTGENRLTNHVQAQVGISVFLPFSWDYRLPK